MFDKRPREANADRIIVLLARNQPADPEKAFTNSEKLRSMGIQIVTVVIHIAKTPIRLNPQYRALATSRASSHSFDLNNLKTSSIDVVLNLCELNTCPQGKCLNKNYINVVTNRNLLSAKITNQKSLCMQLPEFGKLLYDFSDCFASSREFVEILSK